MNSLHRALRTSTQEFAPAGRLVSSSRPAEASAKAAAGTKAHAPDFARCQAADNASVPLSRSSSPRRYGTCHPIASMSPSGWTLRCSTSPAQALTACPAARLCGTVRACITTRPMAAAEISPGRFVPFASGISPFSPDLASWFRFRWRVGLCPFGPMWSSLGARRALD
jgi:hypothetical protein